MGYTSQQFLVCDNSSNANFQAWGSAISAAILAMGWTKTSDTGQVVWASATVPASAYVYEIWQPGDALQTGSTKFYLKVEYGFSATAAGVRISIGTSTNGAGTLTGLTAGPLTASNNANGGSTTYECDFSGDVDRMGMILWRTYSNPSNTVMLGCERTKNIDGTNSSDGVTFFFMGNAASIAGMQTIAFASGTAALSQARSMITLCNYANASDAFANNIPVSPVFPDYGRYGNPLTTLATAHFQDVAEGIQFTTQLYGATRNYLATYMPAVSNPTAGVLKYALRYD